MNVRRGMRGRPLVALFFLLGGWIGLRVMVLDFTAFTPVSAAVEASPDSHLPQLIAAAGASLPHGADPMGTGDDPAALARPVAGGDRWPALPTSRMPPGPAAMMFVAKPDPLPVLRQVSGAAPSDRPAALGALDAAVRIAAARQMLWLAMRRSFSSVGISLAGDHAPATPAAAADPQRPHTNRWSGDAWTLLRRGDNVSLANGPAPATYGASQAGAVVRYSLAPASRYRPSVYGRGTAALNGSGEREAALGLSARPIPGLPVVAAAEVRATAMPGGTRLRPAAIAYTQLPPIRLPRGLRAEAYAQAGYVGGRYATPFADGQLRVDRTVARVGRGELRAGIGAWSGAQKGASRLDIGPAAAMVMGLGADVSARLAVDWRFRVAGNAEPSSGPAVTLSAGF